MWFRTSLSLLDLGHVLELDDLSYGSENYWEWVIGHRAEMKLDITRTHSKPAGETETRIFRLDKNEFTEAQTYEIASILSAVVDSDVVWGHWAHTKGNEFDHVEVSRASCKR